MLKRIRYIKDSSGNYVTQAYVRNAAGKEFKCGFLASGKVGFVKSVDDETINITLSASSPHKIKIKIKKTLATLGCVFDKEARKPRNEIEPG